MENCTCDCCEVAWAGLDAEEDGDMDLDDISDAMCECDDGDGYDGECLDTCEHCDEMGCA